MTFQCLADLELLANFVLKIEKQNMSVTHQTVIFLCMHVRDVSLLPAYRGVLNNFILRDLLMLQCFCGYVTLSSMSTETLQS